MSTAPRSRRGLRVLGEASGFSGRPPGSRTSGFSDIRVLGVPGSRRSGFSELRVLGAPGSRGPAGYLWLRIIDLKELSEKSRRGSLPKISWISAPQ